MIPATIVGALLSFAAVAFGKAHPDGRTGVLARAGELAARGWGLPPWVALPAALAAVSLVTACFGWLPRPLRPAEGLVPPSRTGARRAPAGHSAPPCGEDAYPQRPAGSPHASVPPASAESENATHA